jgi:hypothetical protein
MRPGFLSIVAPHVPDTPRFPMHQVKTENALNEYECITPLLPKVRNRTVVPVPLPENKDN